MRQSKQARALPWTRKGGDAPFDPDNFRFQGPSALGGVEGRSPRLADFVTVAPA